MKKILIVEDEFQIAQAVRELLEGEGYVARVASHGAEALEVLQTFPADLVILDFLMPVMGGAELLAALQKKNIRIPVVIMSEVTQLPSFEKSQLLSYLPKPFDMDQLFNIVSETLAQAKN